jgi:hypothetical protein
MKSITYIAFGALSSYSLLAPIVCILLVDPVSFEWLLLSHMSFPIKHFLIG